MENLTVVQKIHSEFDMSIEKLKNISKSLKEKSSSINIEHPDEIIKDGEFLSSIGFENIDAAKKASQFNNIITSKNKAKSVANKYSDLIKEDYETYSKFYPFHKFIYYLQVIEILEKYGLYIGHSKLYSGGIPKKNINELKDFSSYRKKIFIGINSHKPLCSHSESEYSYYSQTYYICAPKKDFAFDKHTYIIGKEIFRDPKLMETPKIKDYFRMPSLQSINDPIILTPVITKFNQMGFIIVTKWGDEANDENLVVANNN